MQRVIQLALMVMVALMAVPRMATAQQEREVVTPAPDRAEGEGPFDRLVIRGAIVIDGTGGPPRGPVDIVIENNRIARIVNVGVPEVPLDSTGATGTRHEGDRTRRACTYCRGFVDLHLHTGGVPKAPDAEYAYKLWMAHGVTTGRGVAFGGVDWSLEEKERSAANAITAPRMWVYQRPGQGWDGGPIRTPDDARAWVRWAADKGIDGLKLGSSPPAIMAALSRRGEEASVGIHRPPRANRCGPDERNRCCATRPGFGHALLWALRGHVQRS